MFLIKISGQNLFLHKSSNMFTTDIKQTRRYKTRQNAEKWISMRFENNEYNKRFSDLEFLVWIDEEE
jgi:hypothetical protein